MVIRIGTMLLIHFKNGFETLKEKQKTIRNAAGLDLFDDALRSETCRKTHVIFIRTTCSALQAAKVLCPARSGPAATVVKNKR